LIAFVVRGEVFVKEADKEKGRSVNLSNSPYAIMMQHGLTILLIICFG
jgi:hypothetical protein